MIPISNCYWYLGKMLMHLFITLNNYQIVNAVSRNFHVHMKYFISYILHKKFDLRCIQTMGTPKMFHLNRFLWRKPNKKLRIVFYYTTMYCDSRRTLWLQRSRMLICHTLIYVKMKCVLQ